MVLAKILRGSKSQDLFLVLMQTVIPNTKSGSREFSKQSNQSRCNLRNQMTVSTGSMEVHTAPLYSK